MAAFNMINSRYVCDSCSCCRGCYCCCFAWFLRISCIACIDARGLYCYICHFHLLSLVLSSSCVLFN